MKNLKLMFDGVAMADKFGQMARQAQWVGAGSFGLNSSYMQLQHLPAGSQLIVGVPREEPGKGNCLRGLAITKTCWPKLIIGAHFEFHAKYALFRMPRTFWVMIGSANLTHSPSAESVLMVQDEELFKSMAKRHERWLTQAMSIAPYKSVKLSKADLAALSSTVVGG